MKHIFSCEWFRYRKLTAVLALVYLACILFLHSKSPLYSMSELAFILLIIVPSLFSIVLGINQFLLYTKASHWTNLIQKPISMLHIYLGLVLLFLTMLTLIVLLPVTIYLTILDFNSPLMVEPRHYLIIPYVALTSLSFYFAGIFATLHPKKLAYSVVLIPFAILAYEVKGLAQFIPMGAMMIALFLLSWATFKEDLQTNLRKPVSAFSSNIVIQFGIFAILSFIVFQVGRIGTSLASFDLSPQDNVNYYTNSVSMNDEQRMLWNIYGIDSEQFEALENELSLSTFSYFANRRSSTLPEMHKNQPIMDDRGVSFYDRKNQIRWQFSHKHMLYVGFDRNNRFAGWLGFEGRADSVKSAVKFTSVPYVHSGYVILSDKLAQYDESSASFDIKLKIKPNQRLEYSPFVGSNFVAIILTDEVQLYLQSQFVGESDALEPMAIIPITQPINELKGITFAELYEGHLVSINYGKTAFNPFNDGTAEIKDGHVVSYKTQYEGGTEKIADRQFKQGWSDWMLYRDFIISNLYAFIKFQLIDGIKVMLPSTLLYLSIFVMLCVATAAYLMVRQSTKSTIEKTSWILGSAIAGIPGLIACWILSDWKPDGPKSSKH